MKLKGSNGSGSQKKKINWNDEWKIAALALVENDGKSAKEAIIAIDETFGIASSNDLPSLPPSYLAQSGSHIYRFRKEMVRRADANEASVCELARKYGLDGGENDSESVSETEVSETTDQPELAQVIESDSDDDDAELEFDD